MDRSNSGAIASIVGVLALVVSVVALVLAWLAFNNTSDANLEAKIQSQMQDAMYREQSAPPQNDIGTDSFNERPDGAVNNPGTDDAMNGEADKQNEDAVTPEGS